MKKILAIVAVLFGVLLEVAALSGTFHWFGVNVNGDLNYINGIMSIAIGIALWNL